MERDHGRNHQQQLSRSDSFSLAGLSLSPPPQIRSSFYACGYCKREFRSPQGLGGHMNVHRWDRARLIHGHQRSAHRLPSPPNIASPNGRVIDPRLSLQKQIPHCSDDGGSAATGTKPDVCRFTSTTSTTTNKDFEVKSFELGIGVYSHHDGTVDRLDLELRLGS